MWVGPCVLCWIAKKSAKRTSHCSNHEFSSMASIHTSCIRLESGLQIMTTISSQVKWDMLEPIINAASWSAATWRDSIPMILLAWKAATWRSSSSDKWINITSITIIIGLISQLMGFITFNQYVGHPLWHDPHPRYLPRYQMLSVWWSHLSSHCYLRI